MSAELEYFDAGFAMAAPCHIELAEPERFCAPEDVRLYVSSWISGASTTTHFGQQRGESLMPWEDRDLALDAALEQVRNRISELGGNVGVGFQMHVEAIGDLVRVRVLVNAARVEMYQNPVMWALFGLAGLTAPTVELPRSHW